VLLFSACVDATSGTVEVAWVSSMLSAYPDMTAAAGALFAPHASYLVTLVDAAAVTGPPLASTTVTPVSTAFQQQMRGLGGSGMLQSMRAHLTLPTQQLVGGQSLTIVACVTAVMDSDSPVVVDPRSCSTPVQFLLSESDVCAV
jgi:hypothetical protein